jgi:hypothetical protein
MNRKNGGKGQGQQQGRISAQAKELRKLRDVAPGRHYAAWKLTGAWNSATAWGAFDGGGKVDIFAMAAAYSNQGENPYNSFLTREARPMFTIYPEAVGVYLSNDLTHATVPVKSILCEHGVLDIKNTSGASIVRQNLLTLPSGLGIEQRYTSADTAGADKRMCESFGPMSPVGLFRLKKDTVFPEAEQLRAFLTIDPGALTDLKAMSGSAPGRGATIGIVFYGPGALRISTTR